MRFLQAVDRQLAQPQRVTLIGGAAASLAYGVTRVTVDIDMINGTAELDDAIKMARSETGLDIPFHTVKIYDAPYGYEDRLVAIEPGLEKLQIVVPEKHDLALMKIVRGQENDQEAIQQMADHVGLDETTLVERFRKEMTHVIGRPVDIRANFLSVIEMLYGESEAERVSATLADAAG